MASGNRNWQLLIAEPNLEGRAVGLLGLLASDIGNLDEVSTTLNVNLHILTGDADCLVGDDALLHGVAQVARLVLYQLKLFAPAGATFYKAGAALETAGVGTQVVNISYNTLYKVGGFNPMLSLSARLWMLTPMRTTSS